MQFSIALPRLALAILLFAVLPCNAAEPPLQVLYDVRPPFLSFDGQQLQGSVGERARVALERSGIPFELREVPVQRQLLMVQQNLAPVCSVGRLKTAERLRVGVFSAVLTESPPYVAVVRSNAKLPEPASLTNWSHHAELRWGLHAGLYYSDYVQNMIENAQARILRFSSNHQHFAQLLAAGRIDFVVLQEDEAQEMMKNKGSVPRNALRIQSLADISHGEPRFFYCSRNVPEASLRALNRALGAKPIGK